MSSNRFASWQCSWALPLACEKRLFSHLLARLYLRHEVIKRGKSANLSSPLGHFRQTKRKVQHSSWTMNDYSLSKLSCRNFVSMTHKFADFPLKLSGNMNPHNWRLIPHELNKEDKVFPFQKYPASSNWVTPCWFYAWAPPCFCEQRLFLIFWQVFACKWSFKKRKVHKLKNNQAS